LRSLIAIDPGIRGCGVALFRDGTLKFALYLRNYSNGNLPDRCIAMAQDLYCLSVVDEVAFEWPQIYRQGKRTGDPNDLLPLVGITMAFVALSRSTATSYLPREWKGSLDKATCAERVLARLSATERDNISHAAPSLMHNVYDAVGIGLHHLGRFERKRVIAR